MRQLRLLLLFIPLLSFCQEVIINGINLNAPNGFVRSDVLGEDNIFWVKFNEYGNASETISITYFQENTDLSLAENFCKRGTRTTKFIDFMNVKINDVDFPVCFQEGENEWLITSFIYNNNGYTYTVFCNTYNGKEEEFKSSEFENPQQNIEYMIGYMATRFLLE